MATITFLGACNTVTGSRFLLELEQLKLLVDCGLFQGSKENRLKNWESFPVSPAEIDRVFLTHAHIDHTGYLPRLCQAGFQGPVHCTHATRDLCDFMLKDSAHLQEEDASFANKKDFSKHRPALPLFTLADAEKALKLFKPMFYGEDYYLNPEVRVKFKDAGHILGSAFVELKTTRRGRDRKILFSGDLGRPNREILRDPVQVYNVDYLVIESTYGDRLHEQAEAGAALARVINASVARGGVLVIPAFAVGRTQSILFLIRELEAQGKIPTLPIYVDSPMAIDATDIFEKRISDQDLMSRILTLEGKRIFHPRRLYICKTQAESKQINTIKKEAIIISSSGMATGGRILHHLAQRLPVAENTILFIGFQAEGTRGRTILEGHPTVKIHGEPVSIRAQVENISAFSGHADYHEMLAWLMGFNKPPEKTFIIHGEYAASYALAERIQKQFGWHVALPKFKQSFELDL
ncbi:MBL fold metallo-hydrolase [candidate division KSB1 bacterium]|nr:MBL fold metallo-hydrolase [candidate division KSB1 bacterium]